MQTGREFMRKSVRKKSEKIIIKKKQYNNKRVFRQKWKTLNTVYSFFFRVSQYLREWGKSEKKINLRLLFLRIKKFLIEKIQNRISLYLKICDLKEVAKEPKTRSPRKFPDIRYNEEV